MGRIVLRSHRRVFTLSAAPHRAQVIRDAISLLAGGPAAAGTQHGGGEAGERERRQEQQQAVGVVASLPWLLGVFCRAVARQRRLADAGVEGREV